MNLLSTEMLQQNCAPPAVSAQLAQVLESITDGCILVDRSWRLTYLNSRAEEILSPLKPREALLGTELWVSFPELLGTEVETHYRQAMEQGATARFETYYEPLRAWFDVRAYPAQDSLTIYFQDISQRKEAEAVVAAERRVLERIATGAPLPDVLDLIAREAEARSHDGMLCSVLLLDASGTRLLHAAAPSLPPAYNDAIHGLEIGPGVGSCGTAAFEKKAVFVTDVATHPFWRDFKALAAEHGLGACCSTPIVAENGAVLGTIAMYYRRAHVPSSHDCQLIELATQLATVAIQRQKVGVALRESEEQFRALADSIPQLAWMAHSDGSVFWYNQRWFEYTGTTLEEMRGWGWKSVHDPEWLPRVTERWEQSLQRGEAFEMEFPLRGADGVFRWFLTRVIPVLDAQGQVARWFGTNTDVDQVRRVRQALEEETAVLELLNETGTKLASKLDIHLLLQEITDAATRLSGAQFGAFFYNTINESGEAYMLYTLSGAPREAFDKLGMPRATALFAPTFRGEGIIRSDDIRRDSRYGKSEPHRGMPSGHLPVCSYLAVPVIARSGEVLGGLFFGHPEPGRFTARDERVIAGIAAQAAVAIDNARLYEAAQQAARERTQLLESEQQARAEAERMSALKDEFLATLSHELRTPLSAILGWSQILRRNPGDAPTLRQGLETIERNARIQTQLIEDLLDMSRVTSGKLQLDMQRVDLFTVVSAAVETVRPAAEAKGVQLDKALDAAAGPVSGDPQRLQQVVWNLLSNAIKFTPQGGRVEVALQRVDSRVRIRVTDSGVGIRPEFLPHVFERFRQADASTTRSFGGLGLGLSIVKHLVELHGGVVRASSRGEGQGATFTIELPLASGDRVDAPERVPAFVGGDPAVDFQFIDLAGLTVLVVDDEEDARNLVRHVLLECGATVLTASNAREALQMVESRRPDVLVSDIGMPGTDGYALLETVRALGPERGGGLPAVALTAFARSEDRTRALRAGFLVHVAKPVEAAELVATVGAVGGRIGRTTAGSGSRTPGP